MVALGSPSLSARDEPIVPLDEIVRSERVQLSLHPSDNQSQLMRIDVNVRQRQNDGAQDSGEFVGAFFVQSNVLLVDEISTLAGLIWIM